MCSKLFIRKGKSGGVCSSPLKPTGNLPASGSVVDGTGIALTTEAYHTIVLFGVPSFRAHVFRAADSDVGNEVVQAHSMHGQQLRQVEASGQICHYEWTMDHAKKTHLYQTSLIPLSGPDGKVTSILSATQDITHVDTVQPHVLKERTHAHTFPQILIAARENEKRNICRAMHDEIGSASVMLLALVSVVKQEIENKLLEQAVHSVDQLGQELQASLERLHSVVVSLRPPSLDTDGALRGSIEELLEKVCPLGHVPYQFICDKALDEKGICDSVKILLYRTVQEALNNVVKHAKATQVIVSLKRNKSRLELIIKDNGVGFEREKRLSVKHVGLLSMREGIRSISGRLTIQTAPGQGTCIRAVCPCIVYEENE